MKVKISLILCLLIAGNIYSQHVLELKDCYELIEKNHPLGLQENEILEIQLLQEKVLNTNYFPKVTINGQFTYQSDVIDLDVGIPGISLPSQSKDQYKTSIDINQLIYDGGAVKASKNIQHIKSAVDKQNVEIELFNLKKQLCELYFQAIILGKNLQSLEASKKTLNDKYNQVELLVNEGVLLQSNQLVLESELIKLSQTMNEIKYAKNAVLEAIAILTGISSKSFQLKIPEMPKKDSIPNSRPEKELFSLHQNQLELASKLKNTEKIPKLFGFGQLGYGKPGINMLNDEFDTYYLVGIKLSWNLGDWNKIQQEQKIFEHQSTLVQIEENAFEQSIKLELSKVKSTMNRLEETLEKDKQLIAVQNSIIKSYESQLNNGTITTSEYTEHINQLTLAQIKLNTHEINLIKACIDYNRVLGKL